MPSDIRPEAPFHTTADGIVEKAIRADEIYTNQVVIRHKFGFKIRSPLYFYL